MGERVQSEARVAKNKNAKRCSNRSRWTIGMRVWAYLPPL